MRVAVLLLSFLIARPVLAGNAEQPPKTTPKQPAKCGSGCSGSPPNCKCPAAKPKPHPLPVPAGP